MILKLWNHFESSTAQNLDVFLVETMDKYFDSVCELDIMYHIDKAYYIVDEMVANGAIVESNKANILKPLALMDKEQKKEEQVNRGQRKVKKKGYQKQKKEEYRKKQPEKKRPRGRIH